MTWNRVPFGFEEGFSPSSFVFGGAAGSSASALGVRMGNKSAWKNNCHI
jgi:hypothetical protein